ncbi:hypothetical protein [Lishizhenia sp.]|uniref:hypothetical protein n=1 Tax=Lishizhenia sp. TaxID=2497594 RepID=UPI00299D8067|nr:hypothetical protein [Lishizhenia sp.]MDX1447112.1 hypothetical protein [Lishizhenia sp.]
MKAILILSLSLFMGTQLYGQNKLYVEQHGGKRSVLKLGKVGFYSSYYSGQQGNCDTLICKGQGLVSADLKFPKSLVEDEDQEKYEIFNKALKKSVRAMKRSGQEAGKLTLTIKGRKVEVNYSEFKKPGDLKMEITLI